MFVTSKLLNISDIAKRIGNFLKLPIQLFRVFLIPNSRSDGRLMSGLLTRAGYEPIAVDKMEAAQEEVAKLPPGAVVVAAMKFTGGTARELINWQTC